MKYWLALVLALLIILPLFGLLVFCLIFFYFLAPRPGPPIGMPFIPILDEVGCSSSICARSDVTSQNNFNAYACREVFKIEEGTMQDANGDVIPRANGRIMNF